MFKFPNIFGSPTKGMIVLSYLFLVLDGKVQIYTRNQKHLFNYEEYFLIVLIYITFLIKKFYEAQKIFIFEQWNYKFLI